MKTETFQWIDRPPRVERRRDRLGRLNHMPHRLLHGLQGAIFLAGRMPVVEIPGQYWSTDVEGNGGSAVEIATICCPCGEAPVARLLGPPVECDCGRMYYFLGKSVQCFGSPQHTT